MSKVPDAYFEARTTAIRDAAMRVFARHGINASTMQDVASEAGLSAGALYRYFESKDQLVRAVFEQCREENRVLFEGVWTDIDSPSDALFAVGRAVWDEFHDPEARDRYAVNLAASLTADGQLRGEMRAMHADVLERLATLVREMQAMGELRPDIAPEALAVTILSCVQGLEMLFVESDGEIETEGVYQVLGTMLRAFRPAQEE